MRTMWKSSPQFPIMVLCINECTAGLVRCLSETRNSPSPERYTRISCESRVSVYWISSGRSADICISIRRCSSSRTIACSPHVTYNHNDYHY
jgi:hypothetical protein